MLRKLLIILLVFPFVLSAQNSIKGVFSPASEYTWAILYKTTATANVYISQLKMVGGEVTFELGPEQTEGLYRVVYGIPQEENNFDVFYNGVNGSEFIFNAETGAVFVSEDENKILQDYTNTMIELGDEISRLYASRSAKKSAYEALFKSQKNIQSEFEKQTKGMIIEPFVKASKPYISSNYQDSANYLSHIKDTYFKNIDFKNPLIQGSSFLKERALSFILGMPGSNGNMKEAYPDNIDAFVNVIKNTEDNFQRVFLRHIWGKLADNNMPNLANYLAEKHLIPVAQRMEDKDLESMLRTYINLSIGNKAPNFSWEQEDEKGTVTFGNLYELDVAENYIIIFWSSACSHCLKEIPQLQKFVNGLDDGSYKVIAIGLEDEGSSWKSETYYYPEFIHVHGLGKWDNQIGRDYGINSTPTYFVLDKDKKFTLKPDGFESLLKSIKQ